MPQENKEEKINNLKAALWIFIIFLTREGEYWHYVGSE